MCRKLKKNLENKILMKKNINLFKRLKNKKILKNLFICFIKIFFYLKQ